MYQLESIDAYVGLRVEAAGGALRLRWESAAPGDLHDSSPRYLCGLRVHAVATPRLRKIVVSHVSCASVLARGHQLTDAYSVWQRAARAAAARLGGDVAYVDKTATPGALVIRDPAHAPGLLSQVCHTMLADIVCEWEALLCARHDMRAHVQHVMDAVNGLESVTEPPSSESETEK